jgi:hypothetical protein
MGTRHLYWILTGPSFAVWMHFFTVLLSAFSAALAMKLSKMFLFLKFVLAKCVTYGSFSKWSPLAFKEGFTVFPVLTKPKSRGSIRLRNIGKGTDI